MFSRFEKLIDPFKAAPDACPPRGVFSFYLYYLRQVWKIFALLLIVSLGVSLVEVALFSFLGRIVDLAQTSSPAALFQDHSGTLLLMVLVVLLVRPLLFALHDLLVFQTLTSNFTTLIRWQNHRYVLKQSFHFFHNDFAGRIAGRIMQTGNSLRDSAIQSVAALWHVIIYTGSALFLFAQADWRLILPLLAWVTAYILILRIFVPRIRQRSEESAAARSKLMGRVVDGYTNIATLKLFAHTEQEQQYAREAMHEQTYKAQQSTRMISGLDMLITTLNGLLITITCGLALWLWSHSLVTLGDITLCTALVIRLNNMSTWIMWTVNGIFENIGIVQDGIKTIVQPRLVQDRCNAQPLEIQKGEVQLEDIHFRYGNGKEVIQGLNLKVYPGEKIGLIGPSGAGKSTLVNLLLRLYDLNSGRILIDGQDIAQVTQDSLRAQIGMVTQDTSLLHRSIRDNVAYGRPDATEAEIWEALEKAQAADFIRTLRDSQGREDLDALVGERGVKLSGGQRQRIAIARVLLKNAPILILDEATSALDSEVEAAIQESLNLLMEGKTVIAIAHRLSTIARMDRLVVMGQGTIAETGTHSELLANNDLYARLWNHQTGGFVGLD